MSRLLLYLPALTYPLLMLLCMAACAAWAAPAQTDEPPPTSTGDRIAHLQRELAALRAQQQHTQANPP